MIQSNKLQPRADPPQAETILTGRLTNVKNLYNMSYDEEDDLVGGMGDPVEDEEEPLEPLEETPLDIPDEEEYDPDSRYH
ncbi:MAG: hypothetical protein AAB970_01680 [Patescibacteria group bacterium]